MRVSKVAAAGILGSGVGAGAMEETSVSELSETQATELSGFNDLISTNHQTCRFFDDGQMGFEDDYTHTVSGSTVVDQNRYGIGPRGIDYMAYWKKTGTGSFTFQNDAYPVYDTHGNSVALVAKSGTNSFTVSNERDYDAWGQVASNAPNQGYCGNLGHRADDESGLVYMRARYYEPGTGRFVSEDSACHGCNWYIYCSNNPITSVDGSGHSEASEAEWAFYGAWFAALGTLLSMTAGQMSIGSVKFGDMLTCGLVTIGALTCLGTSVWCYFNALAARPVGKAIASAVCAAIGAGFYNAATLALKKSIEAIGEMKGVGLTALKAGEALTAATCACLAALLCIEFGL